jgi:dCMP deaminase
MLNKWDKYFLDICHVVASNSKCYSRKVGAVIVIDKAIISTGYNGPPTNVPPCDRRNYEGFGIVEKGTCPRRTMGFKSGEGLEFCSAGHGERNAIVNAAKIGVSVNKATMYANCTVPCKECLISIINSGIQEVVILDRKSFYDKLSPYLIRESGLIVRNYHLEDL